MGRFKNWAYNRFFREQLEKPVIRVLTDAGSAASGVIAGVVKRIGLRNGDTTNKDFEDPEVDMSEIHLAYLTDSYCMQGVDKYIDMIFKEGFDFYGSDTAVVDYVNLRFAYMAEATGTPTERLFMDIAEDLVKYSNVFIAKARAKDPASLPQGTSVTGIDGADPVAGYFCINPAQMQVKRDKNGTVLGWQQQTPDSDKPVKFKKEDMVHMFFKRNKGDAFGTPFLVSVIPDIKALRQAEENVLKMMYRNIHPFYHVAVGDNETAGTQAEIDSIRNSINEMDVEGGLITTNRVKIVPIASNQVIDASPYLKYLEERVFTGLGIPGLMFGRGSSSSRSNGDNMASEMSDRIKAMQKTIEMFVNNFIIRELLREGGYDPLMDKEKNVYFKFKENNLDSKIKTECHAVFMYEHNAITEDEMRSLIGRDPVTDRAKMHQMIITQANMMAKGEDSPTSVSVGKTGGDKQAKKESGANGSKETNNKNKPKNQHSTKNQDMSLFNGVIGDITDNIRENVNNVLSSNEDKAADVFIYEMLNFTDSLELLVKELQNDTNSQYIARVREQVNALLDSIASSIKDTKGEGLLAIVDATLNLIESYSIEEFMKGEYNEI